MDKIKKKPVFFRLTEGLVRSVYPEAELEGLCNIPDEPCVIVGNHAQLHGPLCCEFNLSDNYYIWCESQMMKLKEVPSYAYQDFWSQKPVYSRPLYKLLSYIIAPLSVFIFNNARTIPVYRDKRVITTFKKTLEKLENGYSIVIFPEYDKKYNNIIYDFQEGFADVARMYYRRTGRELSFVPLYIAPRLNKMCFGKPVKFSHNTEGKEERSRICDYLMDKITDIACSLPRHRVVPYRNIPKRLYPFNTRKEKE